MKNNKRNSSVELFRIIATFLVLIVHFNGWFVGTMAEKITVFTLPNIIQSIIEASSITCVNCFLVITGWYGLRFKWKHVWTIWSILVWIYVPFYLVYSYFYNDFSIKLLLFKIIAIGQESYYVQCYLMLLFLSPILNSFVEKFGKRILPYTLAFWSIEIVFDWILKNKSLAFGHGFMLTHFILMYLLGQTANLYKTEINNLFSVKKFLFIYMSGVVIIFCMYIYIPFQITFAYSNPVNVIMAFSLFFIFERRVFYNSIINTISTSTLAVYIAHITPPVYNILKEWDIYVLSNYSYFLYLVIMAITIIIVYIIATIYDLIKKPIFTTPGRLFCNYISRITKKYSFE